jgi:hypothetical protein
VFTSRYGLDIYSKSSLILISKSLIRHETVHTVKHKKKKQKKKKKTKKKNNNTIRGTSRNHVHISHKKNMD